ncbi:MAG: c-type cytochrome [Betaproteobacteria bacterium]
MKKLVLIACSMMALGAQGAIAGDPVAGEKKSKPCEACHGVAGNSASAEFPRLAGQYYDYLVKSLGDYKTGERKNPIMAPQAANLSRRDMQDLAAYYSKQRGLFVKY